MMPIVSEEIQEQLAGLVEHYDEVARIRQEQEQENNVKGTISKESVSRSKLVFILFALTLFDWILIYLSKSTY